MVGDEGLLQTKYVAYTKLNSASDSAQRTAGGPRRRIQIRMYICMYIYSEHWRTYTHVRRCRPPAAMPKQSSA